MPVRCDSCDGAGAPDSRVSPQPPRRRTVLVATPTSAPDQQTLADLLAGEWRFVVATFAASGIGYLGSSAAPVIVQALIDAGVSHQRAGDLGTVELTTLAITSALVTPAIPHVSHRKLALVGALLAATGVGVSALAESHLLMILGRLIIGVGSGLAIAGANATIAAREDAERVFAVIWTMGGGITFLVAIYLPLVVEGGNYPLGFGVLLVLCLAAVPFMLWIPSRPEQPRTGGAPATATAAAAADAHGAVVTEQAQTPPERTRASGLLIALTLGAMFFYSVAEMALWQFSFDIAVEHGIPYEDVGYFLGITGFVGLTGGALAAFLGVRFRYVGPIVIGSLLSVAGRWIYIVATTPEALAAGSLLWGVGFYFVSPYQIGLAAALDRSGRVAVGATALINLGYGLGPTLGGRIRQAQLDQGLDSTILLVAICGATLVSLLLLLPVALSVDRRRLQPGTGE